MTDAAPPLPLLPSPGDAARTLAAFVDEMIPGDDLFPPASAVGAQALLADRLRDRLGAEGVASLLGRLDGGGAPFHGLAAADRRQVIAHLEQDDPALFGLARMAVYLGYYANPAVTAAVRALGHDYNDAPQPRGYPLPPFSAAAGDVPAEPRGRYKATAAMTPVDPERLAALAAEVGLPAGGPRDRERAAAAPGARRDIRPPAAKDRADVLIIGSGLGGAVSAKVLAEAGLRVVCLEQGEWTRPEQHPHADPDWEWRRLTSFSTNPSVRRQPEDYPIDTRDENTLMWNAVGGSTVVYTATWPRFRPSDFRKGAEHGFQPDWPISYEDLAPWYDANDRDMGVAGHPGDPAIPPRGPFQTVPVPPGPLARVAGRGFDRLGWHWWTMPVAIIAEDYDGRLGCNNCGNCQSGCPRGSLGDVSVTHWPKAIAAGAELRTGARVERIETGPDGRATGAVYVDRRTGVRFFQPADVVIVAANGIGTARLLLLSDSARHPHGLANGNDLVGRHLMHHGLSIVEAWVEDRTDTHKGVVSAALICEEFAETDLARGFINGLTLHVVRLNGAGYQALGSHSGNTAPWGAGHHEAFRRRFAHGFGILCVTDDLPLPGNRVTLSDTLTDSDGLPAPKISYALHPNDRRQLDFGVDRAVELANACGAFDVKVNRFNAADGRYMPAAWHLLGTCRMGDDPAASVTNQWGQTWDVPNLYVMDGSLLPTGGAVNPSSTIGALVLRAASHLRDTFADARVATRTAAG